MDKDGLKNVYKIASELLDSIKSKKEAQTQAKNENQPIEQDEFVSPTAEKILKENAEKSSASLLVRNNSEENEPELVSPNDLEKDSDEVKVQLTLLTGDNINYKKALQYLSNVMNFKTNYQSVKRVIKFL